MYGQVLYENSSIFELIYGIFTVRRCTEEVEVLKIEPLSGVFCVRFCWLDPDNFFERFLIKGDRRTGRHQKNEVLKAVGRLVCGPVPRLFDETSGNAFHPEGTGIHTEEQKNVERRNRRSLSW
jgi:hypothetical protein